MEDLVKCDVMTRVLCFVSDGSNTWSRYTYLRRLAATSSDRFLINAPSRRAFVIAMASEDVSWVEYYVLTTYHQNHPYLYQ